MLDLSLVLSSRFELTTLSRKASVGFSLLFNEKFALLGGIRAAQWERILLQESRFRTGVQDWTRNLYEPLCKLIKLCQQLKEWIFFYHYKPWSRCQKVSLLRERSNKISEKFAHVFYIRAARYIFPLYDTGSRYKGCTILCKIPYITVQGYSLGQNIMEPQTPIPFHCLRLRLSSWQF